MRRTSWLVLIGLIAIFSPASAAINPMASSMHLGYASGAFDQWQRIYLRLSGLSQRNRTEIKVIIRTKGPSMQGLIRVPGAPASNFDTGNGMTAVDLINVRSDSSEYAEIAILEILFTQSMSGQFYEVFAVEDRDQAK
ncbi:hypothetical protein RAD15_06505 [Bradyrhizobium sp. 14AA]